MEMHIKRFQRPPMQRLVSLDVFRGVTIALMVLVNSPGNQTPYSLLEHSIWNGCTLADLVFPFFIVIVGISSVLSLSHLKSSRMQQSQLIEKVIRRSAFLFFIGLILNAFPYHLVDWSTLRILGVLQRIALCYAVSSLLFLTTTVRAQGWIAGVILLGYAGLLPVFGEQALSFDGNVVGFFDRWLLTPAHLYSSVFDPEGVLSTFPAIASALIGNLLGVFILASATKRYARRGMVFAGLFLAGVGFAWSWIVPFNKALWSSSYALWTAGLAFLIFALIDALIDSKKWTFWFKPFDQLGRHAMWVYVLHVVLLKIQSMIHIRNGAGEMVSFREYLTEISFSDLNPQSAALAYAIGYLFFCFVVLNAMVYYKRAV